VLLPDDYGTLRCHLTERLTDENALDRWLPSVPPSIHFSVCSRAQAALPVKLWIWRCCVRPFIAKKGIELKLSSVWIAPCVPSTADCQHYRGPTSDTDLSVDRPLNWVRKPMPKPPLTQSILAIRLLFSYCQLLATEKRGSS